jgi:hypothetical protein
LKQRLARLDWKVLEASLEERGFAHAPALLSAAECAGLVDLYGDDRRFRKRIDMEGHAFGRGDYGYFAKPLPALVQALRTHLYRRLVPLANRWSHALGRPDYPPSLRGFLERCQRAGQERPTPLLLRYERDGYNRLHQDLYGELAFPLQAAIFLSRRERDYRGGELLLVEQRPRMQSRGEALAAEQGELVIFASSEWPAPGKRGPVRATMRHGISTVTAGQRYVLGIIFHDAR